MVLRDFLNDRYLKPRHRFSFSHYVSLGEACRTRYQIERIFKARSRKYSPTTYFFDWIYGPGMPGVLHVFKNRFKIDKNSLHINMAGGTPHVVDRASGYIFLHDFRFSKEAANDSSQTNTEFAMQLDGFLDKYSYLARKTIELVTDNKQICFVFHGTASADVLREFIEVLRTEYACDAHVLNIVQSEENYPTMAQVATDRVFTRHVNDAPSKGRANEWKGVKNSWRRAFNDFALIDHH